MSRILRYHAYVKRWWSLEKSIPVCVRCACQPLVLLQPSLVLCTSCGQELPAALSPAGMNAQHVVNLQTTKVQVIWKWTDEKHRQKTEDAWYSTYWILNHHLVSFLVLRLQKMGYSGVGESWSTLSVHIVFLPLLSTEDVLRNHPLWAVQSHTPQNPVRLFQKRILTQ